MASKDSSKISVEALTEKQAKAEHARLAEDIAAHDRRYYQDDAPTVSDAEYDALRRRYGAIEARFPQLATRESLTQRVGAAPAARFAKVRHAVPMLSLDNAFADADVVDFVGRIRRFLRLPEDEEIVFSAEPKIDGLSMSLRYEDGKLVTAATRGDGAEGEDVTANAKTLDDIPKLLKGKNVPSVCEVRGEVYMTKPAFLALNKRQAEAGKQLYVNPRNTAAGSLRQLDASITASRPLGFFAYAWGEMSDMPADTQSGMIKWFERLRLQDQSADQDVPLGRGAVEISPRDRSAARHARLRHRRRRLQSRSPRLAGAARLRVAQSALGDRAQIPGREGDHSRQGHRDPSRPHRRADAGRQARTGHRRRRRGAERDLAQCRRDRAARCAHRRYGAHPARRRRHSAGSRCGAGKTPRGAKKYQFPKKCPCPLHTDVVREPTATGEEGAVARCTGEFACPYQAVEHLKHFVSRRAFDIDGLGEKQIELFYEKGWVKEPADIFTLQERNEKAALRDGDKKTRLEEVEGFGETSVRNLFAAIERGARSRWSGSFMRSASATSAKRPRWRWRAAMAHWKAFHEACLQARRRRRRDASRRWMRSIRSATR